MEKDNKITCEVSNQPSRKCCLQSFYKLIDSLNLVMKYMYDCFRYYILSWPSG